MTERFRIRKGDMVCVTTGREKGKKGEILRVLRADHRVVVKGVNIVKRHMKPTPQNPEGVVEKELSVHISNVAHVDPKTGNPTRVGVKVLEDGRKVRVSKASGAQIDK
jgi:large subunit ribosomal protein L24